MIEDNKNNDTKEELKTSSDGGDMDNQQANENEDLNKEVNISSSESDNKTEKKLDEVNQETPNKNLENENKVFEDSVEKENETKNKDTKEELKTSSDGDDVDNQQTNKNEDLNKEVNISSSESDNKTEKKLDEGNQETPNKNLEKENETKNKDTEQNEEKDDDPNVKWYVVGAASSFEEKAVKSIQDNARKASLSHFFLDFQIPKQEVVEIKRGKKVNSKKNFFPGYILVKMIMNNQTWQLVKNSNKISGFTGNDHKPIPLSQNEAIKMLKKADDSIEYIAPKYIYEVGQQVKVIDGPFASFNGMVEEVDEEKGRLTISVSIFGRSTPVELEYTQVEKI